MVHSLYTDVPTNSVLGLFPVDHFTASLLPAAISRLGLSPARSFALLFVPLQYFPRIFFQIGKQTKTNQS